MKLKIEAIGDLTGVILPEHLLARLNLPESGWVYATELPNRELRLTPYDPDAETTRPTPGESVDESRDS